MKYNADVLVAGGGPAGIAAAVQCARQGMRVILTEQTGSLGGAGVTAMVPEIMNFDDGEHFLSGGFGRELHDALFDECSYQREWINVRPEPLKRFYDRTVCEAGVQLLLYVRVIDVVSEDGQIRYAIVSGQEGIFAIRAEFYIDCTGNGSLCCLAGEEWEYGDENGFAMPATLCSLWGGVDFSRKGSDSAFTERAYKDGILSRYDTVLPGIKANFPEVSVGGGNIGHCFQADDRTSETLTSAMLDGRVHLAEYEAYYRNYIGGCENAVLLKSADYLGIRESRRIRCQIMLDTEHFSDGYVWEDEIGRYSYPIDIHPMTADKEGMQGFSRSLSMRHGKGESYGIPYRCLVPLHTKNLLVAGRCIGTDHAMQASIRVIPCCFITGQAAGIAAALSVSVGCAAKDADICEIRSRLLTVGAYL